MTRGCGSAIRRHGLAIGMLVGAAVFSLDARSDISPPPRNCATPRVMLELGHDLPRLRAALEAKGEIRIVAIGSSSTAGAGASDDARSYPARLAWHLRARFPELPITVENRGVNGEDARQMIGRFEKDVAALRPHLVVWQVGTNTILREDRVEHFRKIIRAGVRELKATGADVVLMNPQYAPKVTANPDHVSMLRILADIGRAESIGVLRRFDIMRHWREVGGLSEARMLSPDGLHMTDESYDCLASALARSIDMTLAGPAARRH